MLRGTYSIVARDPGTGGLGVAAQSHWFAVGTLLPWAEPGTGAVATQSLAESSHGPALLAMLRDGAGARQALDRLIGDDPDQAVRQIAVVDSGGAVAVYTGSGCVPEAGHRVGDGVSCQASMMLRATVPDAMAAAYEGTAGRLEERLLAA